MKYIILALLIVGCDSPYENVEVKTIGACDRNGECTIIDKNGQQHNNCWNAVVDGVAKCLKSN